MIREAFGDESISRTEEAQTHCDRKGQSRACSSFSLISRGFAHKEFVLAGQTLNSTYYCDVLRRLRANMRRLRPELWRRKNWLLHHDNAPSHTCSFIREFLVKSSMAVVPHHPTVLFSQLKIN
jgi:hypothetical protein